MKGKLFGNFEVHLDPETFVYSREWLSTGTVAELGGEKTNSLKLFYGICSSYDRPFVIDVGSHTGMFGLAAAKLESAAGWLFEPHAEVYEVLCRNIVQNGVQHRFRVFHKALSHFSSRRILKSPVVKSYSDLSCTGQPNYSPYHEQYVDVVALDDLGTADLDRVDVINVDCEGSELFVLIGGAETIARHKPDLLLRVNWACLNQSDVYLNNLTDYLELLGYRGHWVGSENMLFRHPYRKSSGKRAYFADKPDMGGLRVAILKQRYDVFGPWRSEKYDLANHLSIFDKWPSKYNMFETTHLFQADWFVLPFCHDSKLVRQKLDFHEQTFNDNMEYIRNVSEISLDDYDVVISLDPILRPPRNSSTLYAYFQNEHHHSEYTMSVRNPLPGYDLFLDHMMRAPDWVYDLPQPVAFPYPRDPFVVRRMSAGPRKDAIWIDKRFVMMLTHGNEVTHRGGFEGTIALLEKRLQSRVTFRNLDFEDMTRWGDPLEYMREMAASCYYVNLIACGAGQGLCDAASLGLICFGSPKLPYHKAICHPVCLCNDLSELEWKLPLVRSSSDLQQEIRCWQDAALSDRMVTQPIRMLQEAVEMKRRRNPMVSAGQHQSYGIATELAFDELPQEVALINSTKLKQRARSEYEKGNYGDAAHNCRQALWFDKNDHELFYLLALACYAGKDFREASENVAECLKINGQFRPAITLQSILKCDGSVEEAEYSECRARLNYLIYNRFNGYDRELDGRRMEQYNAILDELLHEYIANGDKVNQLLIQHHKLRLNRIAAI